MRTNEQEQGRIARFFAEEGDRLLAAVKKRFRGTGDLDAEDIVQDMLLSLLTRSGIGSDVQSLPAYAYRSVYNRIVDKQRSHRPTLSLENCVGENGEIPLMEQLTDRTSVSGEAERREFLRKLGDAIGRLDSKQRAVFLATEFEDRSYRELAQEWREPMGTLLSRKSRALKALREQLKDFRNE